MKKSICLSLLLANVGISSLIADEYSPELFARTKHDLKKDWYRQSGQSKKFSCTHSLAFATSCAIEEFYGVNVWDSYAECIANGQLPLPETDHSQTFPVPASTKLQRLYDSNVRISSDKLKNELALAKQTLSELESSLAKGEDSPLPLNEETIIEAKKRIAILEQMLERENSNNQSK